MNKPFCFSTATSLTSTGTTQRQSHCQMPQMHRWKMVRFLLYSFQKEKGPGNLWVSTAQARAKGDFRQGEIFLSVNSIDLIVLPALIGSFIFAEGILFSCLSSQQVVKFCLIGILAIGLDNNSNAFWSSQQLLELSWSAFWSSKRVLEFGILGNKRIRL